MNVPHFLTPYVEERTVNNNEGDVSQKKNLLLACPYVIFVLYPI